MRIHELLNERFVQDVPNDEWLQGKREYVHSKGPDSFGVPRHFTATAWSTKPVVLPVGLLKQIPGARGEQQNVRPDDLKAIMDIMQRTGKLPLHNGHEYLPFIVVTYDGRPWVSEGNHRIMAAAKLGWDSLPVEIKYFEGGEMVKHGPLHPSKIGLI